MKIIYQQNGAWVSISPAPGIDIEWVAEKDVPAGIDYEIVGDDDPRLAPPEPEPAEPISPVDKLAAFLASNPDVRALIEG